MISKKGPFHQQNQWTATNLQVCQSQTGEERIAVTYLKSRKPSSLMTLRMSLCVSGSVDLSSTYK